MRLGYLCVVYISEANHANILSQLTISALTNLQQHQNHAKLAHSFRDIAYNRTSFYFLAKDSDSLIQPVLSLCNTAFQLIDFTNHTGQHPTLGTVDHISFAPLGEDSSLQRTIHTAQQFCQQLHRLHSHVPIYYYGSLAPITTETGGGRTETQYRRLQDVRRKLRYFEQSHDILGTPSAVSDFVCESARRGASTSSDGSSSSSSTLIPDVGDALQVSPRHGLMTVGVVPELVRNLNVRFQFPLQSSKTASKAQQEKEKILMLSKYVTQKIRVSGLVEALTLPYNNHESVGIANDAPREDSTTFQIEVACNLLRPRTCSVEHVTSHVQQLIHSCNQQQELSETAASSSTVEKLEISDIYTTGPNEDELLAQLYTEEST